MVPRQPHASATACDQQHLGLIPRSLTDQSAHGMSPNAFFKKKRHGISKAQTLFQVRHMSKSHHFKNNLNLFHTKIR